MFSKISLILIGILLSSNAWSLDNPWKVIDDNFQSGDYLAVIKTLEMNEDEYLQSPMKNDYVQAIGTFVSYVGEYRKAVDYFDMMRGNYTEPNTPQFDPTTFDAVNANAALTELSKTRQVLFINEAHHVPQHRVFTLQLLESLYKNGFRYFSAETLSSYDESALNQRKFPKRQTGYYIVEPLYADIIRQALKIGFKVVAYEHEGNCDYIQTPDKCQDERERGQAQNLVDKILKHDPHAKMIVHAGYGHIDETGGSSSFPWVPMAKYFKDFSGIDPLTIDQVDMTEHVNQKLEKGQYKAVQTHFLPTLPIMLKSKATNKYWTGMNGHYDIQVFSPRNGNDKRPNWLKKLKGRKAVAITSKDCANYPCLVQAYLKDEYADDAIPVDQVLFRSSGINNLVLSKGKYLIFSNGTKNQEVLVK